MTAKEPVAFQESLRARREDATFVVTTGTGETAARIEASAIVDGFVIPRGGTDGSRPSVCIRLRGRPRQIDFDVASLEDGNALLRDLGLDAASHLALWKTASPYTVRRSATLMFVFAILAAFEISAGRGSPMQLLFVLPFVLAWAVMLAVPGTLTIGADGILDTWLWRKRFVRHTDVVEAWTTDGLFKRGSIELLHLRTTDGQTVRIPLRKGAAPRASSAILERIRAAAEGVQAGEGSGDALLEREGRSVAEWVAGLRAIGAGATATLRTAAVPTERLWSIASDPAKEPRVRAAAAVALTGSLGSEGKARLRVLAEATAAPRLRVAFSSAADEVGVERAIAELAELEGADVPPGELQRESAPRRGESA